MRASRWWTKSSISESHITRFVRRCLPSGLLLLLLCSGGRALALPEDACIKDDKCKDHYTKAVKLYKDESYDEALTEFQAAYSARAMPLLLVNIGRTMQKLGRPKEALAYYERYLQAESKLDPDTKKRVDDYILQVKALIGTDADKGDKPAAATDAQKPAQPVTPPPPPPPEPPPPGRSLMIAGGIVAVVGIAGLGAGIGLWASSNSQYNTFQNSNDEFDKMTAKSSAQSLGTGSTVAYIVGTAITATGGVLIGIGASRYTAFKRRQALKLQNPSPDGTKPEGAPADGTTPAAPASQPQPQAFFSPWVAPTGAGFVIHGGF